jgi:hypothetical protein
MYFGEGLARRWWKLTSTHPPLNERIQRIYPYFDGKYPVVSLDPVFKASKVTAMYQEQKRPVDFLKLAAVMGADAAAEEFLYASAAREWRTIPPVVPRQVLARAGSIAPEHLQYAKRFVSALPEALRAATRQPFSAVALVYGMVCSREHAIREGQLAAIADTTEPGILSETSRLLSLIDQLDDRAFLPLADLCLRALRQLAPAQYEDFRGNLQELVEFDQEIDLFEYMLERMILRHLDPHFRKVKRPIQQYYVLRPLLRDCAVLLSGLAHVGQDTIEDARRAFQLGAAQLPLEPSLQFLPFPECNLPQMDAAIDKLAQATPPLKQEVLNALACVVAASGQVTRREAELLRAIADGLNLAIPPFVCAGE